MAKISFEDTEDGQGFNATVEGFFPDVSHLMACALTKVKDTSLEAIMVGFAIAMKTDKKVQDEYNKVMHILEEME